ncbi:MAG: hypothetical protein DRO13_02775 [Thermoprotei archaeon]|nr:MAG: hypothetical protein DRO13_02775 [Thermoprotei archaeon]
MVIALSAEYADRYVGRLLVLRELDGIIDFSKASNQLVLILHLYVIGKPVSIAKLTGVTGFTRKSILDSIRKLEKKKLVVKNERAKRVRKTIYGKTTHKYLEHSR